MAKPKTTYTSQFPEQLYQNDIVEERSLQETVQLQRARDRNVHTKEIQAIQGYLGAHPTSGWDTGDDTINDRIVKIAGTGACSEEGEICNYDQIDPSGFILQNTGILATHWINPTGIPWTPPVPPVGGGAPPWPGPGGPPPGPPGGGVPGGDPAGPTDPYPAPTAPWDPNDPPTQPFGPWTPPVRDGGVLEWNKLDYLQWLTWKLDTNMLRHEWESGETINWQPREYTDLARPVTEIVEFFENFPTSRVLPSSLVPPRASLHDVLMPTIGILKFVLEIVGLTIAVGTVSGSHITFNVPVAIDGGTAGTIAAEVAGIYSTNSHSSYASSNIIDVQVHPAGSTIVGNGLAAPGNHRLVGAVSWNTATGTEVLVIYRKRLIHV